MNDDHGNKKKQGKGSPTFFVSFKIFRIFTLWLYFFLIIIEKLLKNKFDNVFLKILIYISLTAFIYLFIFYSWSPRIRDVNPFDFDTYPEYQDFHGGHFGPFSIKMSTYRFFFSYLNNSTHKDHFCMFTHISPRYNI